MTSYLGWLAMAYDSVDLPEPLGPSDGVGLTEATVRSTPLRMLMGSGVGVGPLDVDVQIPDSRVVW